MKRSTKQGNLKKVESSGACVYRLTDSSAEILLVRSTRGRTWGIPKGHRDDGETLIDACHREVREEAGIHVSLEDKLPVVTTINRREEKDVHSWIATQVGNEKARGDLDPDNEIAEIEWFDINALPPIHKYMFPAIRIAVDLIRQKLL